MQGHLLPGSSCPAMPTSHDPHCGHFPVPSLVSPAADRSCVLRRREHPGLQLSRQRGHGRTHQVEQNVTQISPAGIGLGTVHARCIHHLHEETPVNVEILQQKGEKSWGSQPGSQQKPSAGRGAAALPWARELQTAGATGLRDKAGKRGRMLLLPVLSGSQTRLLLLWFWWLSCSEPQILNPPAPSPCRICRRLHRLQPRSLRHNAQQGCSGLDTLSTGQAQLGSGARHGADRGTPAAHTGLSCLPYLWVGRYPVVHVQAQGFVPAALPDEVGCVQSYVLVQNLVVLERAHRKQQHETHEPNNVTQQGWFQTRVHTPVCPSPKG